MNKIRVILPTATVVEEGNFVSKFLTREEAINWCRHNHVVNYCCHATVKLLGFPPTVSSDTCTFYDEALCIKPVGRFPSKDISMDDLLLLDVRYTLITKL